MQEDEEKMDILSSLPAELSEYVLSFLDAKDIVVISLVSKNWRGLANSDFLWKNLCLKNGIKDEPLISDFFDKAEEESCRWARVYSHSQRRLNNWSRDVYKKIRPDMNALCVYIHGVTVFLGTANGVDVHCIEGDHLVLAQSLKTNTTTTIISASHNTLICGNNAYLFIYNRNETSYSLEAILFPSDNQVVDSVTETETTSEDICYQIHVITDNFVWIGIIVCYVMTYCKVYNRTGKSFMDISINDLVSVKHNKNYVSVLRPYAVQIYNESGQMLCKLDNCCFYTGLVMSSHGIAFLQCQDFCDPEAVYFDLFKGTCAVESKLKVYKLALYKDNLLYLTGQNHFSIVSQRDNATIWVTGLTGSKYLRPGKDMFQVLCDRFVFVCPSLGRLDMFSLFDLKTGANLYDTSISTSTYNIVQVSNTGLLYKRDKSYRTLHSYI